MLLPGGQFDVKCMIFLSGRLTVVHISVLAFTCTLIAAASRSSKLCFDDVSHGRSTLRDDVVEWECFVWVGTANILNCFFLVVIRYFILAPFLRGGYDRIGLKCLCKAFEEDVASTTKSKRSNPTEDLLQLLQFLSWPLHFDLLLLHIL